MTSRTFIPGVVALAALVLASGLYGFGYYELTKLTQRGQTLATEIEQKNTELTGAARARSALVTLEQDELLLKQYSVGKTEVVPFLEELQKVGKPLGASVEVVSVTDEKNAGHARIGLSLLITGSFDSVVRTLGTIEYGPYDAVVTNVVLDTAPTEQKVTGPKVWRAATTLSVGARTASSTPSKP